MTNWKKFEFNDPPVGASVKNPVVLGFSAYFHDSSAAIIKDGKIVAAAEEERFSRRKHDRRFPEQAIKYCLNRANVNKVDAVVYYEDPDVKWKRIKETLQKKAPSKKVYDQIISSWVNLKSKPSIQQKFHEFTGLDNKIIFLDHHLSHAASTFLMSGFNEAAIVAIDGVGEKNTLTWGYGKGKYIELKQCIEFPDSIGLMYTALTTYLGFDANDGEYKVMGLAAYGEQDKNKNSFYPKLKKMITQYADSSFRLSMKYFGHSGFEGPAFTDKIIDLLGVAPRLKNQPIEPTHQDIAAALQMITEKIVLNILNYVYAQTGSLNICLAGGVAYNSVLNGKIIDRTPIKSVFIQPAAGDSGTSLGAAKYIQHLSDPSAPIEHQKNAYLGPQFSDADIKKYLDNGNIEYSTFKSRNQLLSDVASLLAENKVMGWFQGAMEFGPRALGNRSILASPLSAEMRDLLNDRIKHREPFRPFAPAVCIDDVLEYFECDVPIPEPTDYMLMVYGVKQDKRRLLPAITHVDGTARVQTVRWQQNKLFYDLIKEFGNKTGVTVLINTSFNIGGEPMVCSPRDAYECMMNSEIDCIVMGKYLIWRQDNH